jgi:hypothetical protein
MATTQGGAVVEDATVQQGVTRQLAGAAVAGWFQCQVITAYSCCNNEYNTSLPPKQNISLNM